MSYQAFDLLLDSADTALLREALQRAQEILTDEQRFYILHTIKAQKETQSAATPELLGHLETFIQRSKAGYFYREFDIDAKNYTWVPPHTEAWFYELGLWLDKACELVQQKNEKIARIIFEAALPLLEDKMAYVFADEIGDWMLHTEHDYKSVYQVLKQKR